MVEGVRNVRVGCDRHEECDRCEGCESVVVRGCKVCGS